MQQTEEKEKSCENCRHFINYYIKTNMKFYKIAFGHCIQEGSPNYYKKKITEQTVCEFWETEEIRKIERKRFARKLLLEMADRLDVLYEVLKDEEEEISFFERAEMNAESERQGGSNCPLL